MDELKKQVASHEDELVGIRVTFAELIGQSGKDGRIGTMRHQIDKNSLDITRVERITEKQASYLNKILLALAATVIGALANIAWLLINKVWGG